MVTKLKEPNLSQILKFDPHIIADPVPWYIIEHLDKKALLELAQHEIESQREILQARLNAANRLSGIIKGR